MPSEAFKYHCIPLFGQPALSIENDSPLAIDLYRINTSDSPYKTIRAAILRCFPDVKLPTHDKTQRLIANLTGLPTPYVRQFVHCIQRFTG